MHYRRKCNHPRNDRQVRDTRSCRGFADSHPNARAETSRSHRFWLVILLAMIPWSPIRSDGQQKIQQNPDAKSESANPDKKGHTYKIHRSLVYHRLQATPAKPREEDIELKCDVLVPDGKGPFPTILMIHGGAWRSGTKLHMRGHAITAAKAGFVAVSINYRHAPKHIWPAQIEDCRKALDWIKKNAKQYKIDSDWIATWGYSAGGHLAAQLGVTADLPQGKGYPVRAVIAGGAPLDLNLLSQDLPFLAYFIGGTRREFPERYRQASPISHLTKNAPPIFLFHGELDPLVPIDCMTAFAAKAKKMDVVCQTHVVPKKEHILAFFDSNATEKSIEFLKKVHSKDSKPKKQLRRKQIP